MPNISITDFTDFILRTGPPKITKVAEIFNRGDYHPAYDFWKPLRDHICEFHEGKTGGLSFGLTGAHSKKQERYEEAIKGYKKFLKAAKPEWFKPHRAEWVYEDLTVRINPEVGFVVNSETYLVKLYFKQEALTKSRVQLVLALMNAGFKSKKFRSSILDVPHAKLHVQSKTDIHMHALLNGEAATFLGIWESLKETN